MDGGSILIAMATFAGGCGGPYLALKYGLNGLRDRTERIEATLDQTRDHSRDTASAVKDLAEAAKVDHERLAWIHTAMKLERGQQS